MLDFVYYPVSALLLFWHNATAAVIGDPASGAAWALAIVLLVATVRLAMLPSYRARVRDQRILRSLQPQFDALKRAHDGDRAALMAATTALQKEHGVRPIRGCLSALIQAPVFIGLFHVLRSFDRTTATGVPFLGVTAPMTPDQNAATANYAFAATDVRSFLDARLLGAPLHHSIANAGIDRPAVLLVAIPLILVAAVLTFLSARGALARQRGAAPGQEGTTAVGAVDPTRMIAGLTLMAPVGAALAGPVVPVGLLIYLLATAAWTAAQQRLVMGAVCSRRRPARLWTVDSTHRRRPN